MKIKNKIITSQFQHMDFKPHSYIFLYPQKELNMVWKKKLPEPSKRALLKWLYDTPFVLNPPNGLMRITNEDIIELNDFDTTVYELYPSFNSDPIIVNDKGNLYRINNECNIDLEIKSNVSASMVTPIGLNDDKLLLLKKREGWLNNLPWENNWIIECIDQNSKNIIWSEKQFLYNFLPTNIGVFVTYKSKPNKLIYLDNQGNLIWDRLVHESINEIIGVVEDKLWVSLDDGSFNGINMSTGEVLKTIKIAEARNPQCILDDKGRIIVCNGITISIIDALDTVSIISQKRIKTEGSHKSSTTHGNHVLLTKDDYLIYADYYNRIFMIHLSNNESGIFLWEASERIRGMTIVSGNLVVLFGKYLVNLESN